MPHVFTWRTIQTWYSLYKQLGVEALRSRPRADKGRTRKVAPEDIREAIETVLPEFRNGRYTKMALYRRCIERGVPETLYVDNGAIYTCAEINQICSRVGTLLCHTPVRDGAAKGKIERFFRGVRDRFLIRQLDLSSLEILNRQFRDWVENEYHTSIHGTLGMKPIDRFAMDSRRLRFLDPMEANDELFFFEEERSVRKDNTFQVGGKRYEAPRDLSARKIQVRYRRGQSDRILVYYKGERLGEATLLDFQANDRLKRSEFRGERSGSLLQSNVSTSDLSPSIIHYPLSLILL